MLEFTDSEEERQRERIHLIYRNFLSTYCSAKFKEFAGQKIKPDKKSPRLLLKGLGQPQAAKCSVRWLTRIGISSDICFRPTKVFRIGLRNARHSSSISRQNPMYFDHVSDIKGKTEKVTIENQFPKERNLS